MAPLDEHNPYSLCNFASEADCEHCPVNHHVFCHFKPRHVVRFLLIILPLFVINAAGLVRQRAWGHLTGWLIGLVFFLQVPENLILCSHCPYYAEGGRTLRCHANIGLLKLWSFNPRPMSGREKTGFLGGAAGLFLYPVVMNAQFAEWKAAAGGLASGVWWVWAMRRFVCRECPNFSCPLNTVAPEIRLAYLRRNPVFARAWGIEEPAPEPAGKPRH